MIDLTSLEAVQNQIGEVGPADEELIKQLITGYSQWVRTFTGNDFTTQTYDIRRSGRGQVAMQLPQSPVTAVSLLEIDGQAIPPQTRFGGYGYRFDAFSVILDCLCFPFGRSNVRIMFTAGFATIPADISNAVTEMVSLRYKLADKLEWTQKGLAGETLSLNTRDMPASVATILKNYTQVVPL